jgi:L-2-hydroxyglutarate oxidase LhgO
MTDKIDIAIIGGGIIGLAVAAATGRQDRTVYLLEKNRAFGLEQSGRNSEVIHAGLYYPPDSLRARFCPEGNRQMYETCRKHSIPHIKYGKLHVATDKTQLPELEDLLQSGIRNGADVRMLSQKELKQIEPELECLAAVYSPDTGVIDSHALMQYLYGSGHDSGVHYVYNSEVTAIEPQSSGYSILVRSGDEVISLHSEIVINCAGLNGDTTAAAAGIDIDRYHYRFIKYKAEYYSVSGGKNRLIGRLVYPSSLDFRNGIHVCFDVEKRLRLGPYFYLTDRIDYSMTDSNRQVFIDSPIMKALPVIDAADLEPESAAVMVQRDAEAESDRDFIVSHEIDKGLPGFINAIGIGSPGLTCSLPIAKHVQTMVDGILGC